LLPNFYLPLAINYPNNVIDLLSEMLELINCNIKLNKEGFANN